MWRRGCFSVVEGLGVRLTFVGYALAYVIVAVAKGSEGGSAGSRSEVASLGVLCPGSRGSCSSVGSMVWLDLAGPALLYSRQTD